MNNERKNSIKFQNSVNGSPCKIFIFDDIGWWDGYQQSDMKWDLDNANGAPVEVHISSGGGFVSDGIAIYNMLLQYEGSVTTYCDSIAASIASVIFMAGDERIIAKNGALMTHKPMAGTYGNSDDARSFLQEMEFFDKIVADSYERSGLDEEGRMALIGEEDRWINADEAVELGLATQVREGLQAVASVDLDKFDAPKWVKTAVFASAGKSKKTNSNPLNKPGTTNEGGDPPQQAESVDMDTISVADHESQMSEAVAAASKEATERFGKIMDLDNAKGREDLARELANVNSMTVEDVDKALAASPKNPEKKPAENELVDELDGLDLEDSQVDSETQSRASRAAARAKNRR